MNISTSPCHARWISSTHIYTYQWDTFTVPYSTLTFLTMRLSRHIIMSTSFGSSWRPGKTTISVRRKLLSCLNRLTSETPQVKCFPELAHVVNINYMYDVRVVSTWMKMSWSLVTLIDSTIYFTVHINVYKLQIYTAVFLV